jgi:ATP-dependent DNA helicase RecQ
MKQFMADTQSNKFELIQNYRSGRNLVSFTNRYVETIRERLKNTEIESVTNQSGNATIIQYSSENLIVPLAEDVYNVPLSGTTCILTRTNDESGLVLGALRNKGLNAQLIQSNDGFLLSDLLEVRAYMDMIRIEETTTIPLDHWEAAKRKFQKQYKGYLWTPRVISLIQDFEQTNPKTRYSSDFQTFIVESKLEDFVHPMSDTIYISTFHKAKGREFDNIFILLQNGVDTTEEFKRTLYVAMTRSKQNLVIHIHGSGLKLFASESTKWITNDLTYPSPSELTIQLSHEDVQLNFFITRQSHFMKLKTGDLLRVDSDGCADQEGNFLVRFSKKFTETISKQKKKGYFLDKAYANFLVFWRNTTDQEVLIILPVVHFKGN